MVRRGFISPLRAAFRRMSEEGLRDRFRGCMVGAVVGDCMGSPIECKYWEGVSEDAVRREFDEDGSGGKKRQKKKKYTDDSAMAFGLARSLIENRGLEVRDLARTFVDDYFDDPGRGYGAGVVRVFSALREENCEDPFGPAKRQFDGKGSYGNGGAMRIHPMALRCSQESDESKVISEIEAASKITHSNPLGIQGAVIQCLAVRFALNRDDTLLGHLTRISQNMIKDIEDNFHEQIKLVDKFLNEDTDFHRLLDLGNDISALKSVPTAIFSFLKSIDPRPSQFYDVNNLFQRALMISMRFGGDTDTIASMTGAMAGAWHGESGIPLHLVRQCECTDEARELADRLYELMTNKP